MSETTRTDFVRAYLDRVVNRRDITGVDELVDPAYRGTGPGWPAGRDALRRFYVEQMQSRPDWRIDVRETIEVGEHVAVRAAAGGQVLGSEGSRRRDVEWLAVYRISQGRVTEVHLAAVRDVVSAGSSFTSRPATRDDVPVLQPLVDAAIDDLQQGFLDADQIAASHAIMGIDLQLIDDGTYFVVEVDGQIAGCGGWSRRATLYGADHTAGRDSRLLDPATQPARVRAMYTDPAFARRGVGRLILALCEAAARREGFARLELMATLAGRPLYTAAGFVPVEDVVDASGGTPIPLVRMEKPL